jgi:hypothetical protein
MLLSAVLQSLLLPSSYPSYYTVTEKGIYKLEEFDRTPVPGTYSGNRLKKFVKRKGFYKPAETEEDKESKAEVREEEEAEVEPINFKVRVPTLIPAQQSEYIQYKEDDKGNIL